MNYYINTQHYSYKKTPSVLGVKLKSSFNVLDLFSISILREDGKSLSMFCKEFDLEEAWNNETIKNYSDDCFYVCIQCESLLKIA